jgi:hypothetical protein
LMNHLERYGWTPRHRLRKIEKGNEVVIAKAQCKSRLIVSH